MKNPTGPGGADVVRTVTAKVPVTIVPPEFTKYGLFVNSTTLESDLSGNNTITVPIYAGGNLGLGGNMVIEEPASSGTPTTPETSTVSVNVGGTLTVQKWIGASSRKINWLAADSLQRCSLRERSRRQILRTHDRGARSGRVAHDQHGYAVRQGELVGCDVCNRTNPFDNDSTAGGQPKNDEPHGRVLRLHRP